MKAHILGALVFILLYAIIFLKASTEAFEFKKGFKSDWKFPESQTNSNHVSFS